MVGVDLAYTRRQLRRMHGRSVFEPTLYTVWLWPHLRGADLNSPGTIRSPAASSLAHRILSGGHRSIGPWSNQRRHLQVRVRQRSKPLNSASIDPSIAPDPIGFAQLEFL